VTAPPLSHPDGPPVPAADPALALDRFEVRFPRFHLRPISLSIRPGERVALVGPNGAGKSTTMRGLAGRLSDHGGAVLFRGRDMRELVPLVRAEIGFLPETLLSYGWMKVSEHLDFLATFYPSWDHGYAAGLAERLRLPLGDAVGTLSKGTRVKLSFVAAEAFRPPVLLLDEPTSGLDPVVRREIIDTIAERFPAGGRRLVVFSTHLLEDVEWLADRVVVLVEGALRADVSVGQLRRDRPGEGLPSILFSLLSDG